MTCWFTPDQSTCHWNWNFVHLILFLRLYRHEDRCFIYWPHTVEWNLKRVVFPLSDSHPAEVSLTRHRTFIRVSDDLHLILFFHLTDRVTIQGFSTVGRVCIREASLQLQWNITESPFIIVALLIQWKTSFHNMKFSTSFSFRALF